MVAATATSSIALATARISARRAPVGRYTCVGGGRGRGVLRLGTDACTDACDSRARSFALQPNTAGRAPQPAVAPGRRRRPSHLCPAQEGEGDGEGEPADGAHQAYDRHHKGHNHAQRRDHQHVAGADEQALREEGGWVGCVARAGAWVEGGGEGGGSNGGQAPACSAWPTSGSSSQGRCSSGGRRAGGAPGAGAAGSPTRSSARARWPARGTGGTCRSGSAPAAA